VADPRFDPVFRHKDWVDNVDLIQAGGPNGFNIRMNSILSDLQQVSTVVDQIDTALDLIAERTGTTPPGPQVLNVTFTFPINPQGAHWGYDLTGAVRSNVGDPFVVMGLSLPDEIQVQSMRLVGRFTGTPPARVIFTLGRASLTDINRPADTIAEVTTDRPSMGNPFDVTVAIADSPLSRVDQSTFRYFFRISADNPFEALTFHALHLGFVTV